MASPSFFFLFLLIVTCSGSRTHKCSLGKQVESCVGSSAYVFNEATGKCNPQDSICSGTPNSFQSLRDCETNCIAPTLPDLCYLEQSTGPCEAFVKRFYYNATLESCEKFSYGGCGGNDNRFETLEECERHCELPDEESDKNTIDAKKANNKKPTGVHRTHRTSETIVTAKLGLGQKPNIGQHDCLEPPLKGNCSESIEQYFFDPEVRRCKQFIYSGCGGNSNRFPSMIKCEQNCMGHCKDRVEVVDCPASEDIWEFYYDHETGSCLQFEPGKCGGLHSRNIFHNIRQCELSCVEDVCKLMPFGTPCTNETRWTIYYDPTTRTCKTWTDGCLATDNSFETAKHCQSKCMPKDLVCRLPPSQGRPCPTKDQHFYYDVENRRCRKYNKEKCPTTSNHFITYRQCVWMCEENACVQGWAPGHSCETSVPPHYLYNLKTRECESSPRGKCSGSNNHFISEKHCQDRCESGDVCTMPVDHGLCHSSEQRWHFHNETGRCRSFTYTGCGGNGNNFLSESICKQACDRHPCQSPKNLVRCKTPASKYYYDAKLGVCVFTNTTCFVHGKMFESFDQCEQTCVSDNPCLAAVQEESCKSSHTRFYYDAKTGNCTSFEYHGCHGNANNYQSREECQAACNDVEPDTSDSDRSSGDGAEEGLSDSEDLRTIDDEATMFGRQSNEDPDLKNDEMTSGDGEKGGSVFPPRHGHSCLWPLDVGSCERASTRFYFDSKTRTCRQFVYNGCEGNANNFLSMAECNATCVHICHHPIKIGQCRAKVKRYNYNRTSGMCEPFPGSICSNGLNNFINKDTCERICVSDPCLQSKKVGFCKASMKRFYYDAKADGCIPFVYGGCSGNENNFVTPDECRERCRHLSHCRLNPDVNACSTSSRIERFYFDDASGTCKPTRRTPCGLRANNFDSLTECESHCKPREPCASPRNIEKQCNDFFKFERFYFNETKGACEKHFTCNAGGFETVSQCEARCHVNVCTLPSHHGPCDLDQMRYYYSARSQKCRPFIYGGCHGNRNNFETIEECVSHCDPDRCAHPEQAGSCDQHFKRYYSDSATKTCLPFTYSGCGGNSNNFATFDSCNNSCHKTPKCRQSPGQVTECNVCELKPENKECDPSSRWRHFYYDSSAGRCLSFNAGVCGDKEGNSFGSLEDCEERCGLNACKLPPLPAPCSDTSKRGNFFYDRETDDCKAFDVGICGANLNSFWNRDKCENKCMKNVCHLTKDPGPCKGSIRRTYYNRLSGKCEAFYYGGCGGNENNFKTVDDCEKKCVRDPCKLPPDSGICNAYLPHYYYNPDDGHCHQFIYGGCGGNENRFETIEDCLQQCKTTHCNLPPDVGPCLAIHPRFYYNSTIRKCALFYYGGCKGNSNNFKTAESCEETCSSDPCKQPAKVGPCEARINRFYFNSITKQCELFYYGGCDGNNNNFKTAESCEETCSSDPCKQPVKVGPCEARINRFYFNSITKQCEHFYYGGCDGNNNNFKTAESCEATCSSDPCKQPVKVGPCEARIKRFYFNSITKQCELFYYGGCDGNNNNFKTAESCEATCSSDPCKQPAKVGSCEARIKRFYFNSITKQCELFYYGGCDANENNFETIGECERRCSRDPCTLNPDPGTCKGSTLHFYYDLGTGRCRRFAYTGCGGNDNRFISETQCTGKCIHNRCKKEMDPGSCDRNVARFFYDSKKGECTPFLYGGCGGNSNNFQSEQRCRNACVKENSCFLPKISGPCMGLFTRFYYDPVEGVCREFDYGGCQGNGNNFESLGECQSTCALVNKENVGKCFLPKDKGRCYSEEQRFYYNFELETCEPFTYTGCDGNGNNFLSKGQCERECKFDPCKQPKDVGNCFGNEKRWHFHEESQLCRSFRYTGCGGNNNNFQSLESCERWCVKPICRQPVAAGNCDHSLPRYYYDWEHGRCYPFSYSGCNGNDNQFLSMEKCREACNVNPCLQPLSMIGSCFRSLNRHFYNRETGRCHHMYFNGCQENGNNFKTAEECNRICRHVQQIDNDRLNANGRF